MARRLEEIGKIYNIHQLQQLFLECCETIAGTIRIYTEAVRSAQDDGRRLSWQHSLDRARNCRVALGDAASHLGLDTDAPTMPRRVRQLQARALVQTIRSVARTAPPSTVDLTIAEILFAWERQQAELWRVIAEFLRQCRDPLACSLAEEVAEFIEENEHCVREASDCSHALWRKALDLPAPRAAHGEAGSDRGAAAASAPGPEGGSRRPAAAVCDRRLPVPQV